MLELFDIIKTLFFAYIQWFWEAFHYFVPVFVGGMVFLKLLHDLIVFWDKNA